MTLLLIEDDDADAQGFADAIKHYSEGRRQIGVVRARTQRAALDMLEAAPLAFDLILLDLWLPNGQGVELYRAVRAAAPETCIVVVTRRSDPVVENAIVALGSPVLHKLADFGALVVAAFNWWGEHGSGHVIAEWSRKIDRLGDQLEVASEQERQMGDVLSGIGDVAATIGSVIQRCRGSRENGH